MNNELAVDQAVEFSRDQDWERQHGDPMTAGDNCGGEPATDERPFVHTAETWANDVADELLSDDAVVENLRVEISRALYWSEYKAGDKAENLLWHSQVLQERVNRIGNLIVNAAMKRGLTHAKMGVES